MKTRYTLYEEMLDDDGNIVAQIEIAQVEDPEDLPYALAPSAVEEEEEA